MSKKTEKIQERNLKIKDFPPEEKPVERLLGHGPDILSDAELLAVILKTGSAGENVIDLARRVLSLSEDGSLSGVMGVSAAELKRLKGIGPVKAAQILAICQLAYRIDRDKRSKSRQNIKSIAELGELLVSEMRWLDTEVFKVIMVDCRWNIINTVQISEGSVDCSVVNPREVFAMAVRNYAAGLVLVHNHPSGNPTPSKADVQATIRIIKAGMLMGIDVADHIITGKDDFYSMHLNGDISRIKSEINREV